MPALASRMHGIVGSATVAIAQQARRLRREGKDVIALSLGEPDFPTPEHVREAAKAALDAGHTHYTPGPGLPELRAAVAEAEGAQGIPCAPEHVLVTPTKHAVMMALQALTGPGDEVLVPDPGWVSYAPMAAWAGATSVPVALDGDFRLTPDAVAERITPKSRLLLLNSPSNPTGGVDRPEDVRGLMELAQDHDLWVVSDEIYRKILYEGQHLSTASLDGAFERTITVNGLSKSFAMTGWRIGWAVAPPPVFDALSRLQSHSITHCTSFAQHGAVAALTGPQETVKEMVRIFRARRDLLVAGLRALPGVDCPEPRGAFYAFPRLELEGGDDQKAAARLLDEALVAVTPGSAFGARGRGHVRISYAASEERLRAALERLAGVLA